MSGSLHFAAQITNFVLAHVILGLTPHGLAVKPKRYRVMGADLRRIGNEKSSRNCSGFGADGRGG